MDLITDDAEQLEDAMSLFFQTMKRPQNWAHITKQAGIRIDRPAAVILHCLMTNRTGQCRVHDLATQLGIEAPSITRKTQELEKAGYLSRLPDARDKRAISLRVTPRGRAVSNRLRKAQREFISQALHGWQSDERQRFIELFQRFSTDLADTSKEQPNVRG